MIRVWVLGADRYMIIRDAAMRQGKRIVGYFHGNGVNLLEIYNK